MLNQSAFTEITDLKFFKNTLKLLTNNNFMLLRQAAHFKISNSKRNKITQKLTKNIQQSNKISAFVLFSGNAKSGYLLKTLCQNE